jgi:hypothetical protein
MFSKGRFAVSLTAAVVPLVAGFWGYSAYEAREQRRTITAAVKDTTVRLREALPVAPALKGRKALGRLEQHEAALEAHLREVRRAGRAGDPELADGAGHYVLGAREILRHQAASIRLAQRTARSRYALAAHMSRAGQRDAAWIRLAASRKKALEGEYFDYSVALSALSELLWSFPDARKRLAPHIDAALLLEVGPAEDAHRAALREAKRVTQELEGLRRLAPGR